MEGESYWAQDVVPDRILLGFVVHAGFCESISDHDGKWVGLRYKVDRMNQQTGGEPSVPP